MEPYNKHRTFHQNVSGNLSVGTATDDSTLVTLKASNTIYLQKLHVEVTAGSGAVTWTFKDSAGTPINLVPAVSAAAIAHFDFDFGPQGIPLTEGKSFLLDVSATGAAGWITWEAYMKQTTVTTY